MKKFTISFLIGFLLVANTASAASLYIDPSNTSFSNKDTFTAKVRINTDGECINAAQVAINYPGDLVDVIDIGTGESIFSLWVEEPKWEESSITFAGGIPGGYCGRTPGDPGLTNVLATIVFQARAEEGSVVSLSFVEEENQVFLNDGRGTRASLVTYDADFIIDGRDIEGGGEWFDFLKEDTTSPEPFTIELTRNSKVFSNKHYIVFSTTDKGSGMDHYEVLEEKIDDNFLANLFWFTRDDQEWIRASSPYVLRDQTLNSVISVKAVDNAGNERISTYVPPKALRQKDYDPIVAAASALAIITSFYLLVKPGKLRKKLFQNK